MGFNVLGLFQDQSKVKPKQIYTISHIWYCLWHSTVELNVGHQHKSRFRLIYPHSLYGHMYMYRGIICRSTQFPIWNLVRGPATLL